VDEHVDEGRVVRDQIIRQRLEPDPPAINVDGRDPAVGVARGWTYPMATDATKEFTSAMGFWNEKEGWWPGCSTFRRNADGSIVRTGRAIFGPGDAFCPPWHFFSLLGIQEGDWEPH
jgi:hypothetical protein